VNGPGHWAIEDVRTGKCIGGVGFRNHQSWHKKAEIGFVISKDYWRQGITSLCVNAVLDFAFCQKDFNRIEARVDPRHEACIGLLKKFGFKKEGLLRDCEFEHGHFVDLEVYSLLKREYSTL